MTDMPVYRYVPHHLTEAKLAGRVPGPVKATDQLPRGNAAARFNAWFAVKITSSVGTIWCAHAFAALALVSLPSAISSHKPVVLVSWISQTFLQLMLLSVIIVGQNVLAAAADKRAEATYNDADAVLHEAVKIQEHLLAQDKVLGSMIGKLGARRAGPGDLIEMWTKDPAGVQIVLVGSRRVIPSAVTRETTISAPRQLAGGWAPALGRHGCY